MSACRSCGAPLLWCRTTAGKAMPIDPTPYLAKECDPRATVVLYEPHSADPAFVVQAGKIGRDQVVYVSHFASCPNAAAHRRSQ